MCAPSPPPAPDYAGAAQAQGQANIDAAKIQGKINNPNVISPLGTQTVTYGGGTNTNAYNAATDAYTKQLSNWLQSGGVTKQQTGTDDNGQPIYTDVPIPKPTIPNSADYTFGDPNQPTLTQTLSPNEQAILTSGEQAKLKLSDLASQGASAAQGIVGQPLDLSKAPAAPVPGQINQKIVDAMMARPMADYQRAKDQSNSDLVAAGIPVGSAAYNTQNDLLNRQLTDAQTQAELAGVSAGQTAFGQGMAARQQGLSEQVAQQQVPLNSITALMSGSQAQNPFAIPTYAQNAQVAAAPIFQANQLAGQYNTDVYNTKAAQAGNLQSGLFSLGGAAAMGTGIAMSDRRLKSNIQRIGTHPLGIGIYEYDLDGRHERGVMADEVLTMKPSAALLHPDGYWRVDYSQLGGRP